MRQSSMVCYDHHGILTWALGITLGGLWRCLVRAATNRCPRARAWYSPYMLGTLLFGARLGALVACSIVCHLRCGGQPPCAPRASLPGINNLLPLLRYCENVTGCRKNGLATRFNETVSREQCDKCCDVCRGLRSKEVDMTEHVRCGSFDINLGPLEGGVLRCGGRWCGGGGGTSGGRWECNGRWWEVRQLQH